VSGESLRVLLLEDAPVDALLVQHALREAELGFTMRVVGTRSAFLEALEELDPEVVLSDYSLPQFDGMEALEIVRARSPHLPFIVVTGTINEETAVACMKAGASDYVLKDHLQRLGAAVRGALAAHKIRGEQARADAATRSAAREWSATFDAFGEAVFLLSPAGGIRRANRAADLLLSALGQDPRAGTCTWLSTSGEGPGLLERLRSSHRREVETLQLASGWYQATLDPVIDERGELAGAVHVLTDVTDRRRAAEERERLSAQLRQVQKMEALGQLAGGIAHDFNNILTVVIGFGEMLAQQLSGNPSLRHFVDEILRASERAAQLTRRLLNFSRPQATSRQPMDLNALVRQSRSFLERVIGEDVMLEISVSDGALAVVADASQIELLLMNLLTNARDAMPRGGKITIGTTLAEPRPESRVQRTGLPPGPLVCLWVRDTGTGIESGLRGRIFEPFFTTKEAGKGTGLGLSIVYGIVQQHCGVIEVESELGQGTEFRFYVPRGEVPAQVDLPRAALPGGKGETILVAEDDTGVMEITAQVLEEHGYAVVRAIDGEEAVRVFRTNPMAFDLALLDVVMPRRNGREVAEELRRLRPGMRVVFASGYTRSILEERAGTAGDVVILQKPVASSDLLRAVRAALDGPGSAPG
jgi:signal transduction histidine kinase